MQVIVCIADNDHQCSVPVVAQLVKEQVRYDIILLNNKLYPILDAPSTRGDFWWCTSWKILAASAKLYEKITGKRPSAKGTETDLTGDEDTDSSLASPSGAKKLKFEEKILYPYNLQVFQWVVWLSEVGRNWFVDLSCPDVWAVAVHLGVKRVSRLTNVL